MPREMPSEYEIAMARRRALLQSASTIFAAAFDTGFTADDNERLAVKAVDAAFKIETNLCSRLVGEQQEFDKLKAEFESGKAVKFDFGFDFGKPPNPAETIKEP